MRCKIGDLAFIVRPEVPSNLGALVEVVAVWPRTPEAWWVRSLSGPRMRSSGVLADDGMVRDNALRPLRGIPGEAEAHDDCETNTLSGAHNG